MGVRAHSYTNIQEACGAPTDSVCGEGSMVGGMSVTDRDLASSRPHLVGHEFDSSATAYTRLPGDRAPVTALSLLSTQFSNAREAQGSNMFFKKINHRPTHAKSASGLTARPAYPPAPMTREELRRIVADMVG